VVGDKARKPGELDDHQQATWTNRCGQLRQGAVGVGEVMQRPRRSGEVGPTWPRDGLVEVSADLALTLGGWTAKWHRAFAACRKYGIA
jgi:hypothetical protein